MLNRFSTSIRRPVRRQGAERYMFITLLSFAASVGLTRLFLSLTGYPQLGGGELHIAHVLWGGLLLFIAALLPLIWANRWVYSLTSVLTGIGVGLFIDEVGKFITSQNDYFYPAAAPIIYTFFLLTVLVYFQVKRAPVRGARAELYHALDALEDVLDHDLDAGERADLEARLKRVAETSDQPELSRMARELLDYVTGTDVFIAPDPPRYLQKIQKKLTYFEDRYLGRIRFRTALAAAIAVIGFFALANLLRLLWMSFSSVPFWTMVETLFQQGEVTTGIDFFLVRVILEGAVGLMLFVGAILLAVGQDKRGFVVSNLALLLSLTTVDILIFYYEQFSTIILAIFQLLALISLMLYRARYLVPTTAEAARGEVISDKVKQGS